MNAYPVFVCGDCGWVHEDAMAALLCCSRVHEDWRCGTCKEQHTRKHLAESCCNEIKEEHENSETP